MELCEDKYEAESNGTLSPGTFQRCLSRLEAENLIEINNKNRKQTFIKFDAAKVRTHFYQAILDFGGWRANLNSYQQLQDNVWENLLRKKVLFSIDSKTNFFETEDTSSTNIFDIAKGAVSVITSVMISRSIQFYSTLENLMEKDLEELGIVAARLMLQNRSIPFKISIECTPILPESGGILLPEIFQKILGHFERFVSIKYATNLTELDRRNIRAARFDQLDNKIKKYFDEFWFEYVQPLFNQIFHTS